MRAKVAFELVEHDPVVGLPMDNGGQRHVSEVLRGYPERLGLDADGLAAALETSKRRSVHAHSGFLPEIGQ